jgi:hypothetical protein
LYPSLRGFATLTVFVPLGTASLLTSRSSRGCTKVRRVEDKEKSEITWLVYQLNRNESGVGYAMSDPNVIFTLWDDVLTALREGEAPQQSEVLAEVAARIPELRSFDT